MKSEKLSRQHREQDRQFINSIVDIPNVTLNPVKQLVHSWYHKIFHWKLTASKTRRFPMLLQESSFLESDIIAKPGLDIAYPEVGPRSP